MSNPHESRLRGAFGKGLDVLACTPGTSVTKLQKLTWKVWHRPMLSLQRRVNKAVGAYEEAADDGPTTKIYKEFMRKNTSGSK